MPVHHTSVSCTRAAASTPSPFTHFGSPYGLQHPQRLFLVEVHQDDGRLEVDLITLAQHDATHAVVVIVPFPQVIAGVVPRVQVSAATIKCIREASHEPDVSA